MTHLYIKLCDLCGRPCEVNSGMHGGTISTDIMVGGRMIGRKKVSIRVFREEFDACITCLDKLGLLDIFRRMKQMKDANEKKKVSFKKMLEHKKILNK